MASGRSHRPATHVPPSHGESQHVPFTQVPNPVHSAGVRHGAAAKKRTGALLTPETAARAAYQPGIDSRGTVTVERVDVQAEELACTSRPVSRWRTRKTGRLACASPGVPS